MTFHTPLQPAEVIAFLLIAAGYIPVTVAVLRRHTTKYFFTAYTFLLTGAFATNVEGYYPDGSTMATAWNYAEHVIGILGAAVFFCLAAYMSHRKTREIRQEVSTTRISDSEVKP